MQAVWRGCRLKTLATASLFTEGEMHSGYSTWSQYSVDKVRLSTLTSAGLLSMQSDCCSREDTERHRPRSRSGLDAIETREWFAVGGNKRHAMSGPSLTTGPGFNACCSDPISSEIPVSESVKPSHIFAHGSSGSAGGSWAWAEQGLQGPPHPLDRVTITAQQRVPRRARFMGQG